ncbi:MULTISPECIES: ash family protein [Serratia]|uniref:ash family protein n=1 Tax=Serratia TaxID=613 RepID=UPI0013D9E3CA|nr:MULTISPECIES: ash family protein [Serratia]MBN5447576.1 ash family protein [Serratia ureilytica]MBS7521900.1 ash family protein [Serratia ureilytica]MCT2269827.1 ash family protein [Serratia ureilytica]WDF86564.1 ash family protein [Serratia ureilytica]HED2502690.1 ash family protein [Serratia marcescens]
MVAQVGASQEAPVSFVSGNANSAWATTMGLASHVVVRILHTKDKDTWKMSPSPKIPQAPSPFIANCLTTSSLALSILQNF